MASVALSSKAVGSIVKIKVNGTLRDFIVVQQGKPSSIYDESCNGTWLLMKDLYESRQWHSSNVNDYANSTIRSYLNSTFLNLIDEQIRNQIKQVKIPYRPGSGTSMTVNSGANGLSAKIFLLSNIEVGGQTDWSYMPHDGARLAYFEYGTGTSANNKRLAYLNGSAADWWLRSPNTGNSSSAWIVISNGNSYYTSNCSNSYGIRPALMECETCNPRKGAKAVRHHQRESYPVAALRHGATTNTSRRGQPPPPGVPLAAWGKEGRR